MATPEFLKPGGRPASPAATSWFEFLLHPNLLVKHLSNPYAVPGPHQLIVQFLQQANALEANSQLSEPKTNIDNNSKETLQVKEEGAVIADDPMTGVASSVVGATDPNDVDKQYVRKKIRALKLLALKIAAFGNWDLKSLMSSLPGPMVLQLLHELLTVTGGKLEEDERLIEMLTVSDHSDQYFFALLLYQRWCVQTVLQDCLPKKPQKINSIPVPGLTEPVIQLVNISEDKLARIKKLFGKCKSTLVSGLDIERKVCVPTHECFHSTESVMGDMSLCWEKGRIEGVEYWGRQVAFDLGTVYFYETDYQKALEMFTKVETWMDSVSQSHETSEGERVDMKALQGYLKSCRAIVENKTYEDSVSNVFHAAVMKKDLECLMKTLRENCTCTKLPRSAADQVSLLLNQIATGSHGSLPQYFMEVDCLCHLMYIMRGDTYYIQHAGLSSEERHKYMFAVISASADNFTSTQHKNVSAYLRYLLSVEEEQIRARLYEDDAIRKAFGSFLVDKREQLHDTSDASTLSLLAREEYDSLDTVLVRTYNPDEIWTTLCAMQPNLSAVRDFWKLPKDLDRLFNEVKVDVTSVCGFVLVAKAKELISVQSYSNAIVLLNAADKTVRELSGKIVKIIRWEILYVNLLCTKQPGGKHPVVLDLDKKVKSCLYARKIEADVYPHENLLMECVSYLLLSKEWEYLSSLHDSRVAFTEYARQLINVCKELPAVQLAKAPAQVLWETSITIFINQNGAKRARLAQAMLSKDMYRKFVLTINEPLVLSVLISLLTRVYNLKNTDTDIDKTNNFCTVWPDTIAPNVLNTLDEGYMEEMMVQVVQHALSINPLESSWLKTAAEIEFALGNHADALRHYLHAASVSSNHFMQPIPVYVFDNEVYTRLVKSCVQLQQFTQAAILSQFFDEPDYPAAFKYLQEKGCKDGMDLYYPCLWDVNIIEFLIYLHDKRGELDKKQQLIQLMGNPELNNNNPEVILRLFKANRKANFLRILYKQYVS